MDLKELKTLLDEQKSAFELLKQTLQQQADEIKAEGNARTETKATIDKLTERIADLEVKMARPLVIKPETTTAVEQTPEAKAFEKYLRFGLKGNAALDRMNEDERKAFAELQKKTLVSSNDQAAGIFAPEDFRLEVIKRIPNFSNVGALVTRQPTSRDILRYPRMGGGDDVSTSAVSVVWEDETDTVSETTFSMGSVAIPVKKARTLIRVATELLEDSAVNVVDLIQNLMAEAFGHEEDKVITKGAGGKQPEGFMSYALAEVKSGAAADYTYDGLVNLVYSLPEQYAQNARFVCKRASIGNFLKLKDGQNRPIWQPAVTAGAPSTLLGYPVTTNEHMPAVAAGAYPLLFGDLKKLYVVADRIGLSIKRLDEKYADTDEVGFIARRRFGGKVVAPWAAKRQKIAAS